MSEDLADRIYVVIMAGGQGTRLWPLSRPHKPKQFLPLLADGASTLQRTWARAFRLVHDAPERILVVGNAKHKALYRTQLPSLVAANLLLEPEGKNTAPCSTLAALHVQRYRPDAVLITLSADHEIPEDGKGSTWARAMRAAATHADTHRRIVNIGMTPPEPLETRYGYMVCGAAYPTIEGQAVYQVRNFVEKPDADRLQTLMNFGVCLRNMGMFAWRADVWLEAVRIHQPALHATFADYAPAIGTPGEPEALRTAYAACTALSIDHGIAQQTDRLSVVHADVQRVDVGDFSAFSDLWPKDADGNAVRGDYVALDSRNNIVHAGGLEIATIGLEDMVIISDGTTVLICPKDQTQAIKVLQAQADSRRSA